MCECPPPGPIPTRMILGWKPHLTFQSIFPRGSIQAAVIYVKPGGPISFLVSSTVGATIVLSEYQMLPDAL